MLTLSDLGLAMRSSSVILAGFVTAAVLGCDGSSPPVINVPLANVRPEESQAIKAPPNWRLSEFGLLSAQLPTSGVTVLADGQPVRMRATVVDIMPVPPQGRDTLQFLGRRLLLVWHDGAGEDGPREHFVVGGTHLPASLRRDSLCCGPGQRREGRAAPFMELAVPHEWIWLGTAGTITIHPPEIRGVCGKSLRNRLLGFGVMADGCRRAVFDVALDVSLRQTLQPQAGPVRQRAMAPVRIKGVQVLVDCLGPATGMLDVLCAPLDP